MRHTISVLVENKFGVLARVSGMFSGRGFNIDSLNVAPTHDSTLSRITAVLKGDEAQLDLCIKQLRKLVNVVEVLDFKHKTIIDLGQLVYKADVLNKDNFLHVATRNGNDELSRKLLSLDFPLHPAVNNVNYQDQAQIFLIPTQMFIL
jgi:acetolactate synthase-1/3 small subunit